MRGLVCAAVGSLALLIGCGGEDRDGTCRDGISFDGRTYWAAQSDAPVEFAGQLGTGTKPGCTEGPDGQDEDVTVMRIVGSDPRSSVGVEGHRDVIYVAR